MVGWMDGLVGVFWVLRTKTSQQEQLYPLLDHAAAGLVKTQAKLSKNSLIKKF